MTARRWLVAITVMACALAGAIGGRGFAAGGPPGSDPRDDTAASPILPLLGVEQTAVAEPLLSGNPLWAISIRSLSATRERPIFLPSRRPPAPPAVAVVYAEPPKPRAVPVEPERPALNLVGVVTGTNEGFAVFINPATRDVVRLRTGEGHEGWILLSVRTREAVLEKDRRTAVFALPPPGASQK